MATSKRSLVMSPDEISTTDSTGNGTKGKSLVMSPDEISITPFKKKEESASPLPSDSGVAETSSPLQSNGTGERQVTTGAENIPPPAPIKQPQDYATSVDVDGNPVDLSKLTPLPSIYNAEAQDASRKELKQRINNGSITDTDAALLAPHANMKATDVKEAVNMPTAYQVNKSAKTIAGDLDNLVMPNVPDKQQFKKGVLTNPNYLATYYKTRTSDINTKIAQIQKQQDDTKANDEESQDMQGFDLNHIQTQKEIYDKLQVQKDGLQKQLSEIQGSAALLYGQMLTSKYNANNSIKPAAFEVKTESENLGANFKKLVDPVSAEIDDKRLKEGFPLSQQTQFTNARIGLGTRLTSIAYQMDMLKDKVQQNPQDQQSLQQLQELNNQYSNYYSQYQKLSDLYPEVRRQELTASLREMLHQKNAAEMTATDKKETKNTDGYNVPVGAITNLWHRLLGRDLTDSDVDYLSKQTGLPADQISDINRKTTRFGVGGLSDPGLVTDLANSTLAYLDKFRKYYNRQWSSMDDVQADVANEKIDKRINNLTGVATEENLYQPQTVPDLKKVNADGTPNLNYLRTKVNENANDFNLNPFSFVHTVADNGAQFALFAIAGEGLGGVVKLAAGATDALAGAKNVLNAVDFESGVAPNIVNDVNRIRQIGERAGEYAGIYGSSKAMGYDDYYKEASQYSSDPNVRHSYADLMSDWDALGEVILPETDITKAIAGKKALFKTFDRLFTDAGGKLTNSVIKDFGKAAATAGYVAFKEGGEEVVTAAGQDLMVKPQYAKESNDAAWQDFTQDAKQSFMSVFIGMTPNAIGAGIGSTHMVHKESLFEAGNEPAKFADYIKRQQDKGKLTVQEANQRMQTVNTMTDIVKNLPTLDPNGVPYSVEQKIELAAQEYRMRKNEAIIKGNTINAVKQQAEKDNQQADAIQASILQQGQGNISSSINTNANGQRSKTGSSTAGESGVTETTSANGQGIQASSQSSGETERSKAAGRERVQQLKEDQEGKALDALPLTDERKASLKQQIQGYQAENDALQNNTDENSLKTIAHNQRQIGIVNKFGMTSDEILNQLREEKRLTINCP